MNNNSTIFWNKIEQSALDQFESALNNDFVVQWALMPDAHSWYSLPIWWVVSTRDIIIPAWIWFDIWCGMCALKTWFKFEQIDPVQKKIFDSIYRTI